MREYFPIDTKAMKKSTRAAALLAGAVCIALGIYISSWYTVLVGVLILLAIALNKKTAVTERGIEITYHMGLLKRVDLWTFDDIRQINKKLLPDRKTCALHMFKDVMSRCLIFSVTDAEKVIELALEKNPDINLTEVG